MWVAAFSGNALVQVVARSMASRFCVTSAVHVRSLGLFAGYGSLAFTFNDGGPARTVSNEMGGKTSLGVRFHDSELIASGFEGQSGT